MISPRKAWSLARRLVAAAMGVIATVVVLLPKPQRVALLGAPWGWLIGGLLLGLHAALGVQGLRRRPRPSQGGTREAWRGILAEFLPDKLAEVAAAELLIIRYALDWRRSAPARPGVIALSYHKGAQPVLIAMLVMSVIEVVVLHILLVHLSRAADLVLTIFGEAGFVYLLGVLNSLRRLPILVERDGVTVRMGLLIEQRLNIEDIADIQPCDGRAGRSAGVLKACVLSAPNTIVRLARPMRIRHLVRGWEEVTSRAD
jgi:hypothetical protein